ncbi:riboflavin synthase [Legionella waltersii]|uniref:Riboflavin synthase n=1 Tax=Legionella waltersii TaxID=66969 RepID=A0A0W1A2Q9_9GAMM|nr:riboflavin synthase [Legionella waltersii]KTD75610.1 riboflavin synthase subunit alpha [Legionella waltersii]SNV03150.1 riboflavin synthase subunit alpha [Legionella waltersii]
MFTGLIEHTGRVIENKMRDLTSRLTIAADLVNLAVGESISVNGVCLTVLPSEPGLLCFDVSPETLMVTNLGTLSKGSLINLERAMFASTRFGGHYVSGHVDAVAKVKSIKTIQEFIALDIEGFTKEHALYLIPKGSITVEGVSLTINAVVEDSIQLMLVPHTLAQTNFRELIIGQKLNIEFDYLTRIVAHQLQIAGKLNCEVEP